MRMLNDGPAADDASTEPPLLVTPASAWAGRIMLPLPPDGGGGSANVYPDSNVVIVLGVLLGVLVCALGFNSLIRCTRLAMDASPAATTTAMVVITAPAPAGVGLNKKELRKIPVVEYETSNTVVPGTECAICLGEFVDGEKVRLLPRCHHGFHIRCIDIWLADHSSCPICRNSLLEDHHGAGEATVTRDEAT